MELEELIVEIVIGLFLLFTSYQIGIKENITLLHGYHYTQLDPKDKKVFYQKTSTMSKESSLLENDDLPKMHIKMRGLSTPTPIGTGPPPFRRACAGWRQFDN